MHYKRDITGTVHAHILTVFVRMRTSIYIMYAKMYGFIHYVSVNVSISSL